MYNLSLSITCNKSKAYIHHLCNTNITANLKFQSTWYVYVNENADVCYASQSTVVVKFLSFAEFEALKK